jgi:Pregnancy-associated plasma protein-A
MPGSLTRPEYDQGKTAVHEVGHWLSLLHVFGQRGNDGEGDCVLDDGVFDTPLQRLPTEATLKGSPCAEPAVECDGVGGGLTNVDNFMDYSSDECLKRFTDGQIQQMAEA